MALEGITRHPNLWFEDGNVILIAEDIGFRVYRGVLARQSEVFRDTFQIPQPAAVENDLQDCAIVRLSDDSAEEIAIVLNILYNGGHSFYRTTVQISFDTAAAALRLGSKYRFEEMRREALRRISACYAEDLTKVHIHAEDSSDDSSKCPILWGKEDCIAVFHLARQLSLGGLIPAALYRCANDVSIDQLFQAVASHSRLYILSLQELRDCVQSRADLISENIQRYRMALEMKPDVPCALANSSWWQTSNISCPQAMKNVVASAYRKGRFDGALALSPMDGSQEANTKCHSYCAPCEEYFNTTYTQQRKAIWSRLCNKYRDAHETEQANL
ncbi:hypothetical protein BDY19DRAFT_933534 [Irpex rosettiformis]|uniref:Uncharacterized protein n=1 Tax=Irpex rosettiformis TaxID=378272 RepID=A0ACB8U9Z2_9APHY|nr:hypothetical protein BDY19DRAFT_933534 [Irpex rosettiformis]